MQVRVALQVSDDMRVAHAVVTEAFAGTERYVVDVANAQARQGLDVTVLSGAPVAEQLDPAVRHLIGGTVAQALRSAVRLGHVDIAHAHLTYAEFVLAASHRWHSGRLVATRHLATRRGQSRSGSLLRPFIERRLWREIAISSYVAKATGVRDVLHNGVPRQERLSPERRNTVVMAQRLEREKATRVGLDAWFASSLPERGWTLAVAGDGAERAALEEAVTTAAHGASVRFLGRVRDMDTLYADAAAVLAPAPAEPLGLSVLEAMSRGIPVVAAAGGGHLESLSTLPELLFPPGKAPDAAAVLDRLGNPSQVATWSVAVQHAQRSGFDLDVHVRKLSELYQL